MKFGNVKISSKGQIVIPQRIRNKLKSDLLEIEIEDDRIILRPVESILNLGGSLKKYAMNKIMTETDEDEAAWGKHVKEKFDHS